jgi:class 3 adenylate cyclase
MTGSDAAKTAEPTRRVACQSWPSDRLRQALGSRAPGPPDVSTLVGVERKLATALFVDLVDSTSLVSGADPEVARRRVQQYFDRVQQCVISYGGMVEKFAGDAVMAAFGIPQAHEDDAERAIRAALEIMNSVGELGVEARIGIESGEVVVDEPIPPSPQAKP